jgi:hypothetical protein
MPVIKVRLSSLIKKIKIEALQLDSLKSYIKEAFSLDLNSYRIMSTKPVSCIIKTQSDLDQLSQYNQIEIEIIQNSDSMYSEIIKELLEIPSNRLFVINKFSEILKQFPSTSLDALIPNNLELSIKQKLVDIYREASAKSENKNAFKLVYVNVGGKQVLQGLPTSQWINYSTTNLETLTRSLPLNVIQQLNSKKNV